MIDTMLNYWIISYFVEEDKRGTESYSNLLSRAILVVKPQIITLFKPQIMIVQAITILVVKSTHFLKDFLQTYMFRIL